MQSCGNQVKNYDQKTELFISFFPLWQQLGKKSLNKL